MSTEEIIKELKQQVRITKANLDVMFRQWDTGGIPTKAALDKLKKSELLDLFDTYRKEPPTAGKCPKIKDAVKLVLTDKETDLLPKDVLAELIRRAFNSRGLSCSIQNLDWYPSVHHFRAIPRRKLTDIDLSRLLEE